MRILDKAMIVAVVLSVIGGTAFATYGVYKHLHTDDHPELCGPLAYVSDQPDPEGNTYIAGPNGGYVPYNGQKADAYYLALDGADIAKANWSTPGTVCELLWKDILKDWATVSLIAALTLLAIPGLIILLLMRSQDFYLRLRDTFGRPRPETLAAMQEDDRPGALPSRRRDPGQR